MSHVFDDSEDEFEDDYTESIKLISELEKKLEPEVEVEIEQKQNFDDSIQSVDEKKTQRLQVKISQEQDHIILPESISSNSATSRTRSSNRLKNIADTKIQDTKAAYEGNGEIEVLVEDLDDDQEIEYVIADAVENDEQFQSTDSNDELNTLMVEDAAFDTDPYLLQNISKNDELDISEESLDEKSMDEDETGNLKKTTFIFGNISILNWIVI